MSYAANRLTTVKMDVSPSLLYSNLAAASHKTVRTPRVRGLLVLQQPRQWAGA
jgi:hypothetical protein